MAKKIDKLIKNEIQNINDFQKTILLIVEKHIKSLSFEDARKQIKEDIKKYTPLFVKESLKLGVKYISE